MPDDAPPVPVLFTPRLRLCPLAVEHAAELHRAYGDATTMQFWDTPQSHDLAETTRRIEQSIAVGATWHACWVALSRPGSRFIGMVNYHARQPWNRRLAVGWILIPEAERRGYMREAMVALIDHCFNALDTHRVEAEIEPANARSVALAAHLGFRREGLLRDRLQVGGVPRSVEMWALLRPDRTTS